MEFVNKAIETVNSNMVAISTVVGVLFAIAKAVSNEKAPMIVSKVQVVFDSIAKGALMIGKLAQIISEVLASAIKSDGFGGKK